VYARSQGLGGAIIWTISQGHIPTLPAGQRDPLLDAIRTSFLQ
jgi:chitinase